jgi:hypothetical protein
MLKLQAAFSRQVRFDFRTYVPYAAITTINPCGLIDGCSEKAESSESLHG